MTSAARSFSSPEGTAIARSLASGHARLLMHGCRQEGKHRCHSPLPSVRSFQTPLFHGGTIPEQGREGAKRTAQFVLG